MRGMLAVLLLLAFLPCHARAQDRGDCSQAAYIHEFDPRLSPEPCEEVTTIPIRWRGGSSSMRILRPRSMPITDSPDFVARMRTTAGQIGHAMDRMGPGLRLDPVTVMFTSGYSAPADDLAKGELWAEAIGATGGCPVTFYKGDVRASGAEFGFVLSHEVFHCIQYATWPHANTLPSVHEATAEYFAYLATGSNARGDIADFDARIHDTPIDRMSYAAVPYYLWLGDKRGPEDVARFYPRAASGGIAGSVDVATWMAFAKDYFDGNIRMPSGAAMPSHPNVAGIATFDRDMSIDDQRIVPFTLVKHVYTFSRGKTYDLSHNPRPNDARIHWKKQAGTAGGEWSDPPLRVAACDGDKRYAVIFGSTTSQRYGGLRVRVQPADAGDCTCPAGTWQETEQSARHYFEQPLMPGSTRPHYLGGRRLLTLNADHSGSLDYAGIEREWRFPDPPGDDMRQKMSGGSHFTWTIMGGDRLLARLDPSAPNKVYLHNTIRHGDGTVTDETNPSPPQAFGHVFRCDDGGLHLTMDPRFRALSPLDTSMDFVRIDAPAPPAP